jgi:hypothetical protein
MRIRGTATDKLADVIQTLLLVRKTGMLTVQRDGPGDSYEQGTLTLHNGQVMDATAGPLRGADAYKKLNTWTTCQFVFQALSPTAFPQLSPPSFPRTQMSPEHGATGAYTRRDSGEFSFASVVPYRTQQFQGGLPDFQYLGLSRTHRQLFLLIDGKRSIQDLTRLIGRHPQEVLAILAELESAGLIRQ